MDWASQQDPSSPSIQSSPPTYSFLTVQGSSGQFQTVPTYLPTSIKEEAPKYLRQMANPPPFPPPREKLPRFCPMSETHIYAVFLESSNP